MNQGRWNWWDADDENPFQKRLRINLPGTVAERLAAKRVGARLQPGSGSLLGAKGDMVRKTFLIESKSTQKESLGVKLAWLRKIEKEALDANKDPALMIQFTDGDGRPVKGGVWVAVPEKLFLEMADDELPEEDFGF